MFLTVEGVEGSGKSTLLDSLAARLEAEGRSVMRTREPGGSSLGAHIRPLVLSAGHKPDPRAELFLFLADRAQHVAEVVKPALAAEARLLRRALPRCEAAAAEPVPREVLAALVNEEPWLPRVWDRLVTAEADPETALSLARRAALFDLSPAPWLRMRELARGLGRTDAWRQAQNALESYLLPREERLLRLRRLRPALRARCPELADEPNRVLALESAFQRDEYLSFERQVLYDRLRPGI